jgi:acyl-CoA thioesterase-1
VRLIVLFVLSVAAFSAHADTGAILVFGDSVSAGFGISPPEKGWVTLLQTKLQGEGYGYHVINASVSGETTAGGLARLPRALSLHHPKIVLLELGGNDGLRALPIAAMRTNLSTMAALAQAAGADVLLLGMRIPPNYGPAYTEQFVLAYGQVAHALQLHLVPFLLQDIALSPELMQADGIHPNELGQPRLLENVWTTLKPMLHK